MNNSAKNIEWPIASEDNSEYICCIACYYPIAPLNSDTITVFYRERFGDEILKVGYMIDVQNLYTKDFDNHFTLNIKDYWKKNVRCYKCREILSDGKQEGEAEKALKFDLRFQWRKIPLRDRRSKSFVFLFRVKINELNAIEMKKEFDENEKFKEYLKE